jgi:AcrR family transcriptional regulator
MTEQLASERRVRLNRQRVLESAVAIADEIGIEALSMRRLSQELEVVPMALYKHVENKEQLLDGMVEVIVRQIEPADRGAGWKPAARDQVLAARRALQRHAWSRRVIESRTTKTPAVLDYIESFTGLFIDGGFSVDLTHHVMHAIGGRMWGFTQELFDDPDEADATVPPEVREAMLRQAAAFYPNIVAVATSMNHDDGSIVGHGCDDQFEFEFALDILLDGFERLHERGWTSRGSRS